MSTLTRPAYLRDEHLAWLDRACAAGVKMWETPHYLGDVFPTLTSAQASLLLQYWMQQQYAGR